jgi:carbonic anhydrase
MITAQEAITRLKEGNLRFAAATPSNKTTVTELQRRNHVDCQEPFAIILGCSDSRVPAEIVFDQGLGDLFVIRVAGNIVAPSQVGSVEFAVAQFKTPLVIVLGHSGCGAVKATIDELENPSDETSSNVLSIVNRIRPTVEPLFKSLQGQDRSKLMDTCVHANILAAVGHLRHGSQMLEELLKEGALTIIGAEYSLNTGKVTFLD